MTFFVRVESILGPDKGCLYLFIYIHINLIFFIMADAPNAPEETNLIPTGGGRRRNTRPRRGEGLGVTRIRGALPEEANIPSN